VLGQWDRIDNLLTMASSSDDWTLVTRNDKKRRTRKTKATKRESKNVSISHVALSFVECIDTLRSTLEQCMKHLQRTDLFESTIQRIRDAMKPTCSTQQQKSVTVSIQCYQLGEIVCYGIGNFSATSLEHYSASLWQLAFVICLRNEFASMASDNINVNQNKNHIQSTNRNETSLSMDTYDIHNKNPIPLVFYDPVTTNFERNFLLDNVKNCAVLDSNERGRRAAFQGIFTLNACDKTVQNGARMTSLYFMPHCPASLYENVLWSNWDNIMHPQHCSGPDGQIDVIDETRNHIGQQYARIILIGNSIQSLASPLANCNTNDDSTDKVERRCMQSLLPWMEETSIQTSKADLTCPGNLVGAFNDTYLCSWNIQKSTSLPTTDPGYLRHSRPYDTIMDGDVDPELL
jgi:SRR1